MNIEGSVQAENELIDGQSVDVQEGNAFDAANEKLITFVTKNIEKWKMHLHTVEYSNMDSINKALIDHPNVAFSLNVLYQRVRFDAERAQHEYDNFNAQAYMQMKEKYNNDKNKKEWYSVKELEYQARNTYKSTYDKLAAKRAAAEGRKSFVQRVLDQWASYQFVLQQISKNLIAEAQASGLDFKNMSRMPATPEDL